MEIRPATSADAEIALAFFKKMQDERLQTIFRQDNIPSLDQEKNFLKSKSGENGVAFICVEASQVIGMAVADRKTHPQLRHSCEFGIGVLKEHRNKGVGTRLIERLTLWAQQKDLRRLELSIIENNLAGIRLYRRLGFCEEGRRIGAVKVGNTLMDLIEMVKLLQSSNTSDAGRGK